MSEDASYTGRRSGIDGFNPKAMRDTMLKGLVETAVWKEKNCKRRSADTMYKTAIANFWGNGVYTTLGNVNRELDPAEICGKLKALRDVVDTTRLDPVSFAIYKNIIKRGSARRIGDNRAIFIHWCDIKNLNTTYKKYRPPAT